MRIVILGAGYAGVTLARRLESTLPEDVDLVVVDESDSHLLKHEVHRVIRRPSVADPIQVPLTDLFGRASVRIDRVTGLDRDSRIVHFDGGDSLSYDYAAVCLGSVTADYGIPGIGDHGQPLRSISDALAIRTEFFEAAGIGTEAESDGRIDTDSSDASSSGSVSVVVGGAGLSGVQTAGELAALAREESVDADVTLIEQLDSVAPNFPGNFQQAVRSELESRGVTISTGTTVERGTADTVETDRGAFDAGVFVWTGGITGTPAMAGERPNVRGDLRLDEHTFVVGDAARAIDTDGEPVPASASAAIREARTVATNLVRLVEHAKTEPDGFKPRLSPYRFDVPGWIVSVGDGTVAQLGPEVVTGSPAKALKTAVGAGHLRSVGAIRNAVELVEAELYGGK